MLITDNDQDEERRDTRKKEWVKKTPPRITGSTRCWMCYATITLTDYDDPDIKIAIHLQKSHNKPIPGYLKEMMGDGRKPFKKGERKKKQWRS